MARRARQPREWLSRDLPLSGVEVTWGLGNRCRLSGSIRPEVSSAMAGRVDPIGFDERPFGESPFGGESRQAASARADTAVLLVPWQTELVVTEGGQVSWRGIVTRVSRTGPTLDVDASGVLSYLDGLPWTSGHERRRDLDPADAYRLLWAHAQAFDGGDLGVVVDDTQTPVRLATERRAVEFDANDEPVTFEASEWWEMAWWDAPDIGQEAAQLAGETPFDVREEHQWADSTREDVASFVRIGYPRIGRRREDVRLVEGENILEVVVLDDDGDDYATEVVALGAGEGRKRVRSVAASGDGDSLRRPLVAEHAGVTRPARAGRLARRELDYRHHTGGAVSEVTVSGPVPVQAGDDVLVTARPSWGSPVRQWSRVVTITRRQSSDEVTLGLTRSEAWRYE